MDSATSTHPVIGLVWPAMPFSRIFTPGRSGPGAGAGGAAVAGWSEPLLPLLLLPSLLPALLSLLPLPLLLPGAVAGTLPLGAVLLVLAVAAALPLEFPVLTVKGGNWFGHCRSGIME